MFSAGFMVMIVSIFTILPGTPLDIIWTLNNSLTSGFRQTLTGLIFGFFILVLGLIVFYAGWGLLIGKKLAWWIIVIIFAINSVSDIVRVALGGIERIFGVLIVLTFLFY